MAVELGSFGVWSRAGLWEAEGDAAAELEELGYGALWLGGSPGGDLDAVTAVLRTTRALTVATGIVNVWAEPAERLSATFRRIDAEHPGRFLVGVGASHPEAVSEYVKPYDKLVGYLDELDVPDDRRVLAALGPRVLKLAADRTAGAHPYLVTPEHTATARELLGAGKLLAPEQHVVLETDPVAARALARKSIELYLGLRNYTGNWLRLGYEEADLADGGSDRLVDALVAWGSPEQVAARLRAHLDAGADHVAVQVVTPDGGHDREAFRELAKELF
ncbi:LLM class F420-dependent oxidoreductase [Umezawaea endophytica]|uniref:LLM class F420-dependent oxidoreductase n=1 Tax=Umezawaea endophytica TaxID=1654476 RepID=A0A9X2VRH4_9PSEU|nr:LLM class F420-dependent oxidoreductase [Umezawaea endophytica]MCS7480832.1 LLM class F420-dependent oxidoreductase [Umezawaea endophytica]